MNPRSMTTTSAVISWTWGPSSLPRRPSTGFQQLEPGLALGLPRAALRPEVALGHPRAYPCARSTATHRRAALPLVLVSLASRSLVARSSPPTSLQPFASLASCIDDLMP